LVTLSSGKEVSFDVAVHDAKMGAKGGKKRCKQRPQWVMIVTDYDGGNDEKADNSGAGHVTTCHIRF
jgi:hypothetical protein